MQSAQVSVVTSTEQAHTIPRLLVVRLSAMGDVLHALPAVAGLRAAFPETDFGWVVEERWADLVRSAYLRSDGAQRPLVDRIHSVNFTVWRHSLTSARTIQEGVRTIKELRASGYDAAIDFQGAARSAIVARLSGAPSIYGFAEPRENVASMFYTTIVVAQAKHIIQQNLELAAAVAGHSLPVPKVEFRCHGAESKFASPPARGYVILNPGAGWGAKQWPAECYGEVAKRLASQFRLRSLINGGPGEDGLMRAVQEASGGAAEPISCSPSELVALMKAARLFIGGDTGPMHLAAALGVPVVAIFGPTDPARTGPFGTRSIVLRNPNSRMTLSHESSPDRAMLEISAEDVVHAAIQLLREAGE